MRRTSFGHLLRKQKCITMHLSTSIIKQKSKLVLHPCLEYHTKDGQINAGPPRIRFRPTVHAPWGARGTPQRWIAGVRKDQNADVAAFDAESSSKCAPVHAPADKEDVGLIGFATYEALSYTSRTIGLGAFSRVFFSAQWSKCVVV